MSGTKTGTDGDDLSEIEINNMVMERKKNTVYGAGEGDPSTGAVEGCQAGPAASTSCNRGRPGVDRQALGRASASGDEEGSVNNRSTSVDSNVSRTEVSESEYVWNKLPLERRRESSDDERSSLGSSSLAGLKKRPIRRIAALDDDSTDSNADFVTVSAPKKRKRNTAQSFESDMEEAMFGQATTELDAKIIRAIEEVERIVIYKNLKWMYVKRLIIASRKIRTASAIIRERVIATCENTTPTNPLRYHRHSHGDDRWAKKEGEEYPEAIPRTWKRLCQFESKEGRLQETVMRLTRGTEKKKSKDKKERAEDPTVTELEDLFRRMNIEMRRWLLPSQSSSLTKDKGVVSSGTSALPAAKSTRLRSIIESSESEVDDFTNIVDSKVGRRRDRKNEKHSKSAKGAGNSSGGERIGKEKKRTRNRGDGSKKKNKGGGSKESDGRDEGAGASARRNIMPNLPQPPRCAAVALQDSVSTYAETRSRVPRKIRLSDLRIADVLPKREFTDVMTLGTNGETAKLKLTRLDISTTLEEVAAAVAEAGGGCHAGEVNVGKLRITSCGLGSVWLRCPLTTARKICSGDDGKGILQVGWSRARVHLLSGRKLQCFKCLETGHVRQNCESTIDRSDLCYKCGEPGHWARNCSTHRTG